jgi:hypothetical protein
MTQTIVCIVEGDGEVRAVPLLLRRLAQDRGVHDLAVPTPIRVHRDQFLRRPEEFERKLSLAVAKAQGGVVMVLLDADDDCPVFLAKDIEARAQHLVHSATLEVVICNREYEAWFLAAAESLAGRRGLRQDIAAPLGPDGIRNAKGWLTERIAGGRYHEVSDQPAMTAVFDIELAFGRSRSFRKLVKSVEVTLGLGGDVPESVERVS